MDLGICRSGNFIWGYEKVVVACTLEFGDIKRCSLREFALCYGRTKASVRTVPWLGSAVHDDSVTLFLSHPGHPQMSYKPMFSNCPFEKLELHIDGFKQQFRLQIIA